MTVLETRPALAPAGRPTSDAQAPAGQSRRRWWILAVLGIAQLMVVLDTTIVNIALPHAQTSLGFSDGQRQWIITAYSLAFGSLLLLGGRLSDLMGRKRTFIIGLIGCFQGMRTKGGTEGVGRSVTSTVVLCSMLVIVADVVLVRFILVLFPAS